ncbi:helix-turn-helix transcriptional regulator [Arthrobacter crystallopoietes]|uniref:helix-turn-helix transcriptional regulator n=1 Tax=Crystallibacter crystallopoietes TaxID=37928 RepID=UPI0011114501|nr:helix-turn-helix domain-containing protein [Arthrobacter crystallopoietes]
MNRQEPEGPRFAAQDQPEQLLTRNQVAQWLNMAPKTLANLASSGRGPDYVKFPGGALRYERAVVEAWIASSRRSAA